MLVLSSPSGAGKTTISRKLLERDGNLSMSISVTTRPRRPGEVDGDDYHFIDAAEFDRLVGAGALLEHAKVFGNYYGTPRAPVERRWPRAATCCSTSTGRARSSWPRRRARTWSASSSCRPRRASWSAA